jgi:hypothetical protein
MCGATVVATVVACSSGPPIVYTDRVPYEWEMWEAQQDAGVDAAGDAATDGDTAAATAPPAATVKLTERLVFPIDHYWNKDISNEPVDPQGFKYIEAIGADVPLRADFTAPSGSKAGYGIPFQHVRADHKKVPVEFLWADESDPGPYPIPDNPLIENGPDKHLLVIDQDNWVLYELYHARLEGGKWKADSGAIFDMKSNKSRPAGWTSADAAGLAIFPGLVRADEVHEKKAINHALRFTVKATQRAYVFPATHFASDKKDTSLPPMGMWCRLKASFNIDGFSPSVQVILRALKKHGMILADNGSNFYVSGAPDPRWSTEELKELGRVKGRDLEVVKTGPLVTK